MKGSLARAFPLAPVLVALRSGAMEPEELVERCLERAAEVEPALGAILDETGRAERLRAAPRVAGPLGGVPVAVKDLFNVDGLPTRAGSALPASHFAGPESEAVRRLRAAGAIVFGKSATDEFAYADPPTTRNPHDARRSPGGSSAGSAAAVAAGIVPLALGSQTTRSIVAPAAYCGVCGFKPSWGRGPMDGAVALSPSMDVAGLFAQDVAGLAMAAPALAEGWRLPEARRAPVFGLPLGGYLEGLSDRGWRRPFDDALATLRRAGQAVRDVRIAWPPDLAGVYNATMVVLHGEMRGLHAKRFAEFGDLYRERSRRGIERGDLVKDAELARARDWIARVREAIHRAMDEADADVLLSPSQPCAPPELGGPTGSGETTSPWSFAGLPCASVPYGEIEGLPAGLQAIGRFGEDEALLAAAAKLDRVLRGSIPPGIR